MQFILFSARGKVKSVLGFKKNIIFGKYLE
jgi:hypothetical protein